MNAFGNASGIRRALLGILLVLVVGPACDNGGGMNGDDNSPPNASVIASTTDPVVGDTVALDASGSDDPDGDELTFSWTLETPDGSNATISSPTTARPWYVPDTSGDYRAEVTVSDNTLSDTDNVSIEALERLPETVTVPVENVAADGDSLVTGTVTWEDSVVAEDIKSADVEIPASRDEGQLCVQESDLFNEGCKTLTPTSDFSDIQEISVERKTVELTVIPDPPYGDPAETDVTVYEPFQSDSTKFTGENTVELPKRSDGLVRQVATDLITDDPDKGNRLDRLTADTTVTANSDVELSAQPSLLPACSDSINSDQGPFVKDKNDPGCFNDAGTAYDPEDDNELHNLRVKIVSVPIADTVQISGAEDQRTDQLGLKTNFPKSVTVAVGGLDIKVENLRESNQTGEGYSLRVLNGSDPEKLSNSQTSDISEDSGSLNGWHTSELTGISRFGGRHFKLLVIHQTKVNDSPPSDGNDDVVFNKGDQGGAYRIAYPYEPDHPDLQDGSNSVKTAGLSQSDFATLKNGECMKVSATDTVCMNGVPDDF